MTLMRHLAAVMAGGMLLWGCGTLRLHVPTGTSIHTEAKCSAPGYLRCP